MSGFRRATLDEVAGVPIDAYTWHPLRAALQATAMGVSAWTADEPGKPLIEPHDETSTAAGAHEELYIVLRGRATFTIAGEEVDAPAGTFLLVDVGTHRQAVAAEAATTVLALGAPPRSALPISPFEHYYAAQPAYDAGDFDRAIAIASEGLRDWPDNPIIHYQLACYEARAGRLDRAREHLDIAFAGDERTRAWAAEDDDLAPLRERG